MVLVAFLCDLMTFVLFPITDSPAYAVSNGAIIFGTLLGGRVITAAASGRSKMVTRSVAAGVVGVVALFGVGYALESRGPRPVQPSTQLASYLEANHLTNGVGAYWSAAITTLESHGAIGIRPVIEHGSTLVRYEKNSDAAWYTGVRFNYVVYNAAGTLGWRTRRRARSRRGVIRARCTSSARIACSSTPIPSRCRPPAGPARPRGRDEPRPVRVRPLTGRSF